MSIQLINIGFGNMVSANRIIAVISPESAPVKRTDSSHVILSAIQPETVANRFNPDTEEMEPQ